MQRGEQLGWRTEFCLTCRNAAQTLDFDELVAAQAPKFNKTMKPVVAWIESISVLGDMEIKFNASMSVNLTEVMESQSGRLLSINSTQ